MNPETQNLINNTIGNPMNPNPIMPTGDKFSRFFDRLKSNKKLALTVIAIIFLICVLIYFATSQILNRFLPELDLPISNNQTTEFRGLSNMQIKVPKNTFSQTEKIPVSVAANSENIPITAFDVVIEYDSAFLTLTKKSPPALKGYEYYGKNNDTITQVSAILKPDQTPQKFDNTTLFDIEFTPKKKGKTILKMIYLPGSTSDSNLLNDKSEDILGIARGVEITIE